MTTALEIANGAATHIGVKTAEIALEADDFQVFLDNMNDMLIEWSDLGLTPQFVEVDEGGDTVAIDSNARAAVKANLAMRVAPSFHKVVSPALALLANESLEKLYISTDFIGEVAYPDTLPSGSGNQCPDNNVDQRFFPTGQKENF